MASSVESRDLVGAEIEPSPVENRELRRERARRRVREQPSSSLIDCPPSPSPVTLNALTGCDSLLIPLQCEYYAPAADRASRDRVLVRDNLNLDLAIEGLLHDVRWPHFSAGRRGRRDGTLSRQGFPTVIPRNVRRREPQHPPAPFL